MEVFRKIHVYCKNNFGKKCSDGSKYDWLWVLSFSNSPFSLIFSQLPLSSFIHKSLSFYFPFISHYLLLLHSFFLLSLLFMISRLNLSLSLFSLFLSTSTSHSHPLSLSVSISLSQSLSLSISLSISLSLSHTKSLSLFLSAHCLSGCGCYSRPIVRSHGRRCSVSLRLVTDRC